jgi:RNA polymerase sigma-70 factor (ECF subfamily)
MTSAQDAGALDVATLYHDHHGWLHGWLRRKLGCSQSAADLAQDTFLRLLNRSEPLQIQESRAFLTTVAKSVLSNHFRRQKLERAYLEALAALPEVQTPSLEEQAILLETLIELDRLLDGLAAPLRKAFLWSQVEGLGQMEIAERLGVSLATVKRYIVKAGMHCFFAMPDWETP